MSDPRTQSATAPTLGQLALAIALAHLGEREEGGPNRGAIVRWSLELCIRDHRMLGLSQGLPWCAGFASRCVWQAWAACAGVELLNSSAIPIALHWPAHGGPSVGLRAAVSELVDDARASGAWRDRSAAEEPQPGDLLVWSHHVGLCSTWSNTDRAAICGNDADQVQSVHLGPNGEHPRCGPLLGWIVVK